MKKSAQLLVTVTFVDAAHPNGYLVRIAPEEGEAVGRWGGSGNIDANSQIIFRDVPPGRYILYGRPNPGRDDQQTEPITVELKGGESMNVGITANRGDAAAHSIRGSTRLVMFPKQQIWDGGPE